ncbi:MAG: hypothetical protein QM754_10695 [Tepidisphaeraceae bacterium]
MSFGQAQKPQGPVEKPRLTIDKQELPPAVPRGLNYKLGVIGNKLDALPEEVCSKLFSFGADVPMVQQTRRDMTKTGIDFEGFNYFGEGVSGFARTVLMVDRGRVQKLILAKPSFTREAAQLVVEKIVSDSQVAPKKDGDRVLFKIQGIRYYIRPVGHWEKITPGGTKQILGASARTEKMPDKKVEGPGGLEIGVTDFDWIALHITSDKEKLDSILKGKLMMGMSFAEAYAAMRGFKCYRDGQGKLDQVWTWTAKEVEEGDTSVLMGDFGTYSRTVYNRTEKLRARATFKDGLVVKIENEETMIAPPTN